MNLRQQTALEGAVATRDEQLARLASADEHLTSILAEMAALQDELERLRSEGNELLRALAEYDATSAERDVAMSALEEECATLRLHANAEAANLAESNALLEERRRHVRALERDVETLRSKLIERDRGVAAVEAELAAVQDELTRRQQSLVQEHSRVEAAESALVAADRRTEALSRRLESEARERERLQSEARERERLQSDLERLQETARSVGTDRVALTEPDSHLRFVPGSAGYALSEAEGPPPRVRDVVEVDGRHFAVSKLGHSPLPGDRRRCAFLAWDAHQTPRSGEGGVAAADDTYAAQ